MVETPKSERNQLIEANRAQLDPNRTSVPFQSGGGRFYTPRMMANLRHMQMVLNSIAKRKGTPPGKLFYGDAW